MIAAQFIVALGQAWFATGAIVGLAFLLFGIERMDSSARGAYGFRPLLLPGLALLWPYVLLRWAATYRSKV